MAPADDPRDAAPDAHGRLPAEGELPAHGELPHRGNPPPAGKTAAGGKAPAAGLKSPASLGSAALRERARRTYQRGNRFFDLRILDLALAEWRQASWIWRLADAVRPRPRQRHADLRAVILLLLTVLLVLNLIYGLFPRGGPDVAVNAEEEADEGGQSWWEHWLDTGHPESPGAPSVTLRDWWQRMQRRWRSGEEEPPPEFVAQQDLDERWGDLLARYRRRGAEPLDFHLIAGYGYIRTGAFGKAARAFEAGLPDARLPRQRADLYQGLANAFYYEGYRLGADGLARYDLARVRRAAEAYERSVAAESRALPLGNLGWMYFVLGEYGRAEQASLRALALDKGLHYVRLNLGLTYLVQNRLDEAYAAYRAVLLSQPDDEVLSGGINDLREWARDHPGRFPFADLMIGLLERANGDVPRAERALRRFLRARGVSSSWRHLAERALQDLTAPAGGL
jgi:tetratricopeptide (TPR) repeat protein